MELYVQYESICTHSYHENKPYGDWEEDYDFSIRGVAQSSRGQWSGLANKEERFNVAFDAEADEQVFVLYMVYSTGDSFGRSTGEGEILWVFKDEIKARDAMLEINNNTDVFQITFYDDSGQAVTFSNPGAGYFEYIQGVYVEPFKLQP